MTKLSRSWLRAKKALQPPRKKWATALKAMGVGLLVTMIGGVLLYGGGAVVNANLMTLGASLIMLGLVVGLIGFVVFVTDSEVHKPKPDQADPQRRQAAAGKPRSEEGAAVEGPESHEHIGLDPALERPTGATEIADQQPQQAPTGGEVECTNCGCLDHGYFCSRCGHRLPVEDSAGAIALRGVRSSFTGQWRRFAKTLRCVILEPEHFFRGLHETQGFLGLNGLLGVGSFASSFLVALVVLEYFSHLGVVSSLGIATSADFLPEIAGLLLGLADEALMFSGWFVLTSIYHYAIWWFELSKSERIARVTWTGTPLGRSYRVLIYSHAVYLFVYPLTLPFFGFFLQDPRTLDLSQSQTEGLLALGVVGGFFAFLLVTLHWMGTFPIGMAAAHKISVGRARFIILGVSFLLFVAYRILVYNGVIGPGY